MNGPRYEKVIYKHQLVYFSSSKLGVTRPAGWRASACRSDLCYEQREGPARARMTCLQMGSERLPFPQVTFQTSTNHLEITRVLIQSGGDDHDNSTTDPLLGKKETDIEMVKLVLSVDF